MLLALGENAEALRTHHPENIKDIPLFAEVAKCPDMVFISTDTSQRTRKEEAERSNRRALPPFTSVRFLSA